jgi:hypothetical protein
MMRYVTLTALSAALISVGQVSSASAEPRSFNGLWTVQLVTESGPCSSSYRYALAVHNGQVRVASGGGASISGHIAESGRVGLNIQHSAASGVASGRLRANSGSGTWTVSSVCSGRWTARRSPSSVAQTL